MLHRSQRPARQLEDETQHSFISASQASKYPSCGVRNTQLQGASFDRVVLYMCTYSVGLTGGSNGPHKLRADGAAIAEWSYNQPISVSFSPVDVMCTANPNATDEAQTGRPRCNGRSETNNVTRPKLFVTHMEGTQAKLSPWTGRAACHLQIGISLSMDLIYTPARPYCRACRKPQSLKLICSQHRSVSDW